MDDLTLMNDPKAWTKVIDILRDKTDRRELVWADRSQDIRRPNAVSPLYVAAYGKWAFLIYRCRVAYTNEFDQAEYEDDVAMELVNKDGQEIWRLPKVLNRFQLIDSVQFHAAEVSELLSQFLADSPTAPLVK